MTKCTTTTTSKSSPQVAMVTPCYMGRDGVGNTIRDYLNALSKWQWPTHLYHCHRGLEVEGITSHCVDMANLLLQLMNKEESSLFSHSLYVYQYVFHYPLLDTMAAIDKGRVIVEYHGITPPKFFPPEDPYHEMAKDILSRHEILDYADAIVVHSQSMKVEFLELHPFPKERIHLLPLGVDRRYNKGVRKKELVERYSPTGGPLLLYVGRLSGNKRVDLLIDMLSLVKISHPNATLVLLGAHERTTTSVYYKELESKIKKASLAGDVHFLSNVSDDELPDYYRSASLFVTASEHEGFCIPVAEAMSCATPCVVANVSATPETMGAGGLTFTAGSAEDMAQKVCLALEADRLSQLQSAALRQSEKYSAENFQKRLKVLFSSVEEKERRERPPLQRQTALLKAAARSYFYYEDKQQGTTVGDAITWLRRKLTLPCEASLVRSQRDKQSLVNELLCQELAALQKEVEELAQKIEQKDKAH